MGTIIKKPRTQFDRTLARIADGKMWELVPACIDYIRRVIEDETASTRDRLRAVEMVLARRIPTLQSVQGIVGHVNLGDGQVDWASIHRRAIEVLERNGERNGESVNGDDRDSRIH